MINLKTPIQIKGQEFKNRLVMPPMETVKSESSGKVTDALCEYYQERSAGNYIGLIITEHAFVSLNGRARVGQLSIASDDDIPGLKRLVDCVHANGTKIFAQISHAGGKSKVEDLELMSASAVRKPTAKPDDPVPREMTIQEIQTVIKDFASAAARAKQAGFDGIELHSAHGYLLNQFYSPYINKRKDEYAGNTIKGRIKLHTKIIKEIRKEIGNEYILALRLGASDYLDGGTTIEDSIVAAKEFEKESIDLLDVSGGMRGWSLTENKEQGYFKELAKQIKPNINIPVILTGGIVDAKVANSLIQDGTADMIGVGRAIFRNATWAKQAMEEL